jgi:2-polyprenyl-6-methoxyphenol hydroxylase-like FAD-dependent oxidoreductase
MPSPSTTNPTVAIIGAGVAGLTTALHFHAHGITNIHIFESADKLLALGVGINIQPSATLVLRNLGLLPVLEETGISTQEIIYHNKHGDVVTAEKRGTACGYDVPQLSVHRGEFQMILLNTTKERLGEDCVHVDHAFTHFEQEEGGNKIKAYFSRKGGSPAVVPFIEADVLIAADGINSTMRRILYPNEGPQHFSGRILWRAAIEWDSYLTGASMVWAGTPDHKFIAYPISAEAQKRGRSLINWICELRIRDADDPDTTPPEKSNWLATVPKERFLPSFEGWEMGGLNVKELVEKTDQIYEYPMCDRDPVDRWHFGRLVLTGDAAHPMYPGKCLPSCQ